MLSKLTYRIASPRRQSRREVSPRRPVCRTPGLGRWLHGFTLIELVLVLALLASVLSLAAPSLARFFRGRNLDSEAQRFLALTRYAQSRAVAEGVPMVLWVDADAGTYGLEMEATYSEDDRKAVQFEMDKDVAVQVEQSLGTSRAALPLVTRQIAGNLPVIRFTPDGSLADSSFEYVLFREAREGETGELWVSQNRSRLGYEIRTNEPIMLRQR